MARWTPVPVAGDSNADDCAPFSSQDSVNYLYVPAESEGARSAAYMRGLPGCTTFSVTGSNAPIRGSRDVEGKLLAVSGNTLYRIGTGGAASSLGTIPGVGRVSMTHNQVAAGNEVVIGNGQSGYVYDTVADSLVQITDPAFPGFKVCDFVDGYIAGVEPQGKYWFISDLAGALLYNGLDRQEAETQPDDIVTLIVSHRDVLVLGKYTGQFFSNTGAATGTFQNRNGCEMDVGCAGTHLVARCDNSVFFIGHDGIFYRVEGYQPVRKSRHSQEQAWSRSNLSNAFMTVFEDQGHKIVYVTCPDGGTLGYDVSTDKWHRRESFGLDRWRMNTLTHWNGMWMAGDYSNGSLYQLDWNVQSEAGEEMERRRRFAVMHDGGNALTLNAVRFEFDTGLGSETPSATGWVNAFSLGDCALSVFKDGSVTAMTAGEMTADGVTLSADANGLVTLTAPAFGGSGGSYEVRVTPAFPTLSRPVRLTEIESSGIDDRYAVWSPAPLGVAVDLVTEYQFTPDQSWIYAGSYIYKAGI